MVMRNKAAFYRRWLIWFALILAVVTTLILPFILRYESQRLQAIKEREYANMKHAEFVVDSMFRGRIGDIRMLSGSPSLQHYVSTRTESARIDTSALMRSFCRSYEQYDQLRVIRRDGQELIRINYDNGTCREVPAAELQNKVDRYYFTESLSLTAGNVFVSPMDLNVERGQVEVPYKPMIRFAQPLTDTAGKTQAVIVLNFRAQQLLDEVFALYDSKRQKAAGDYSFLLNDHGAYLSSQQHPERGFGFMFDHPLQNFSADYPQVWQAILDGQQSVATADGLFLIHSVPVPVSYTFRQGRNAGQPADGLRWHEIQLISNASLQSGSVLYGSYSSLFLTLYVLLIGFVSYLWAEIVRRNEALLSSGQLVKALFDNTPVGIISVDEKGRIVMANIRACEMFGYNANEMTGLNIQALVPEHQRGNHLQRVQGYMQSSAQLDMSMRSDIFARRRDGSEFPVNISLRTNDSAAGKQVICTILDISLRKQAETQRELAYNMIEKAGDCFYHVDLDDGVRMTKFNNATLNHFGVTADVLETWRLTDWNPNVSQSQIPQLVATIRDKENTVVETTHRLADGRIVPVEVSINHYVDHDGRHFAYGWFRDISLRQETQRLLLQARESAEAANRAKTAFVANISHEIRTPLNSVIGLTHILEQRTDLSDDVIHDIGRVKVAGQLLLALVNDILDFSKIEAGEINLERVPLRLGAVLRDLDSLLREQAIQKGLTLNIAELPDTMSTSVLGDPTRLRQIFINLLSNAIKFTTQGSVSLSVEPLGEAEADAEGRLHQCMRFRVEDTGIGIDKAVLPKLFMPFQQADSSFTRTYGGTGLGLVIVKQLCEEMGGSFSVDSTPGKGSCFTVDLCFPLASEQDRNDTTFGKRALRILLAEDNDDERENLAALCRRFGWEVTATADGGELLQLFAEMEAGQQAPDSLIVDWVMPGIDGLETLRRLHETHSPSLLPASLMVTGYEVSRLLQSPLANLPDIVLPKPVGICDLFNKLNLAFQKHSGEYDYLLSHSRLGDNGLAWLGGVRILLVDDSSMNLYVTSQMLELESAIVTTATNGQEAVDWLQSDGNRVDIVLMDIQMPVMDGYAAVRLIRQNEALRGLPVVALTAGSMASEHQRALDAGMNDYLTKPCEHERLVHVIRRHVEISRKAAIPVVLQGAVADEQQDWPEVAGIETRAARERSSNDLSLYMQLLRHFTRDNTDLTQLSLPQDDEGLKTLRMRMHKLTGSAGVIGAEALCVLARNIENNLQDGHLNPVSAQLQEMVRVFRLLQSSIATVVARYDRQQQTGPVPLQTLDKEQLQNLREALQHKRYAAITLYRGLEPALSGLLSRAILQQLSDAIGRLAFEEALALLDELPAE